MRRAVMLGDVIGAKAGKVTSGRDVQASSILLPQAAARVVRMIENTKAYCRLTITLHEPLRRRRNWAVYPKTTLKIWFQEIRHAHASEEVALKPRGKFVNFSDFAALWIN